MPGRISYICSFLLLISCSQNPYDRSQADWEPQLYMESGAKEDLERYFELLDAKNIKILTAVNEDYEGFLQLKVEESEFLKEKKHNSNSLDKVLKRLAYLLASRVEYIHTYYGIEISYNFTRGDSYQKRFYSLNDLNIPDLSEYESEIYEEEAYEESEDSIYHEDY